MATIGGGTDDATIEDTVKVVTEDVNVSIDDLTKNGKKLTVSFGGPPKDEHVILTNGEKTLYVNARTSRRRAKPSKVTLIDMSCADYVASHHGQKIHAQPVLFSGGTFSYDKNGIELKLDDPSFRDTKLIRWISPDHLIIVVEKSSGWHCHYDWDVKEDTPKLRWKIPKISGSLTDFDVSWDDKYCLLTSDKEMMLFSSMTRRSGTPLVIKKIEAQAATFMKEGSVIALIQVTYRAGAIIVKVEELHQPDSDLGISPRHWDLRIITNEVTCQNVSHCHYYDERLYVLTRNTLHVISVNLSSGPGGLMPLTDKRVSYDYILRAKGFRNTILTYVCTWTTPTRTRPKLKSIRRIDIEYVDVGKKDDTPTVEDEALPNETAVGQVDPVAEAQNDDDNSANVGSGKKDDDATHTQAEVKMEVPTTGSDRTAKQNDVANDYVDATDDDKFDGDEEDDGTHHDSNGEEKKTELDEYDNARASGRVRQVEEEAAEEPIVATTTDINPLGHLLFGYGSDTETDDESDEALSALTNTNSLNASNLVEDEVSSSNTMGEVVDQTPQDRTDNIDGNLNASLEQASKNAPINREVVSPSAAKPPAKEDAVPISSYLESDVAVVTSPGTSNVTKPPHAAAPSDEDGLTTRLIPFPSSQQDERDGNDQRRNDQHGRVVAHLPVAADNKNAGGAISEDNADGNDLAASDEEVESSEIDDDATLSYHGESSEGGEEVEEEAEFPTRGGDRTVTQDDVSAEHEPSNEDRSNATAGNPKDDSSMDLAENPPVQNLLPEEGDVAPRSDMTYDVGRISSTSVASMEEEDNNDDDEVMEEGDEEEPAAVAAAAAVGGGNNSDDVAPTDKESDFMAITKCTDVNIARQYLEMSENQLKMAVMALNLFLGVGGGGGGGGGGSGGIDGLRNAVAGSTLSSEDSNDKFEQEGRNATIDVPPPTNPPVNDGEDVNHICSGDSNAEGSTKKDNANDDDKLEGDEEDDDTHDGSEEEEKTEVDEDDDTKSPAKGDANPISSYLESDVAVVTSPGTSNVTKPPHAAAPSDEDGLTTRLIPFPSFQQDERNGNDQRRNDQHGRVVAHLPVAADNKNAGGAISEDNADGNDLAASDEEVESSEIDDDATLSYHGESSEGGEKVEEEVEFPTRRGDRTVTQDDVSAEHEPSNEDRSNATAGNPNDDSSMDLAENPPVQNFPPEEGDVAPRNDMADVDSGEDDVAESTGSENTLDSDAQPDEVEDAHSVQEGRNAPIREVIYVLSDSSFAEEESDSDSTYTDSSSVTHGRGAVIDLTSDSSSSHSSSAGNPNDDSSMDLAENPPVQNLPPEEGDVAPRNDMADVDSGEDDVAESTGSENTLDSDAQPDEVEDAHSVQERRNAPIREVIYVLSDSSFAEEESDSDSTYTDSSSVTHGRGAVIDLTSDSSPSPSSSVTLRSLTNEQREDENEHPFDQFDSDSDTEGQGQESGAEQPAVQQQSRQLGQVSEHPENQPADLSGREGNNDREGGNEHVSNQGENRPEPGKPKVLSRGPWEGHDGWVVTKKEYVNGEKKKVITRLEENRTSP